MDLRFKYDVSQLAPLFRFSLSAMILCAHLLYMLVLNYSTHNTILPIFLLFSIYLWASCTCSNGNVLSSTGFNQPVLKRFHAFAENSFVNSALYCSLRGEIGI